MASPQLYRRLGSIAAALILLIVLVSLAIAFFMWLARQL